MKSYLEKRGLTEHIQDHYMFSYDEEEVCFSLYTPTLKLVGVQYHTPGSPKQTRYKTKVMKGYNTIFGLDTIDYTKNYCFVQEGVFDAICIHELGFNAVAILSNANTHAVNQMKLLVDNLYSIVDNDSAGMKLARLVDRYKTAKNAGEDAADIWERDKEELRELCNSLIENRL